MYATSDNIKKRTKPNDKFYTPQNLVETHIDYVKEYINNNDIIYEPFAGKGAYKNEFIKRYEKTNKIKFTEIDEGLDFFDFNEEIDLIISNPPYSIIDKVLNKSIELKPKMISYLIGLHNLTTRRIEIMNKNGYYLDKIKMLKVYKWFGMSCICVFVKNENGKNCIDFDRTVYK